MSTLDVNQEPLVESIAHALYAAGPWGDLHDVDDKMRECVFSHNMEVYRSMASMMLDTLDVDVKRQPDRQLRWRLDQIVAVKTVQRSLPKLLQREEPLVVTRRGEPIAVLVPIEQYTGGLAEREASLTDAEKVETMCDLVTELEKALRSKRLTVQVMPDGVEIIEVESGRLVKKLMVTEVGHVT